MNRLLKNQALTYALLVSLFVPVLNFLNVTTTIAADLLPEEQPFSLSVQNEPLGQVLKKIETETGLVFSIEDQWRSFPVSASLHQTPLHKGLKRILANLNNVIIYGSNNQVKIVILGKVEPAKALSGPAGLPRYQPTPAYQQPGSAEASEPEPDEPREPETPPEVEKEEANEADSRATDEGIKVDEPGPENTLEESAAEEKAPAEDAPEKPAEVKDQSLDAGAAANKQSRS